MNRNIIYSIIIPHKNIPKLLQRCLDSIPRRDDVQIIVVDDNSDPDKVDFKYFPGLNDPFVEVVFTKEGKGAGFARNVGLSKAVGKWLLFADADDFYNYCINDILDEYVNSDVDVVCFKHNSVDCNTYTTTFRCLGFIKRINYWLKNPTSKKADYLLRYLHIAEWSKLFKTELIRKHNIVFDEVSIAVGVTFIYLAGYYASSIIADNRAMYCTTIRQGSIRNKKHNNKTKLDEIYVSCKRFLFFRRRNIPFYEGASLVFLMIKSYFLNRELYNEIKYILDNLGYTPSERISLYFHDILFYTPAKAKAKLFSIYKKMI